MNIRSILTKGPKPVWIRYFLIIGLFFLITRTVLDSRFQHSALLYVLIPYLASVVLYIFIPQPQGMRRWQRFTRHILSAFIVMLGTSALLFEGFLCVIMFMPIYLAMATIAYAFAPSIKTDVNSVGDVFKVSFVPLLVIVMSLEGINQTFSFKRFETVTRSQIVSLDIEQIKANLAQPIHLDEGRSAFLSLFPLPEKIEAGSLRTGDVHKARFVYKRWGFTNIHRGETWVKIAEVAPNRVRTEIIKDTSYFSKYMTISGTVIDMRPLPNGQTEVSLTIKYKRLLDPSWYFGPLQRRAMNESADYLIQNVIAK